MITKTQLSKMNNDFVKFCKDNNCLDEAYNTLKGIYNVLEDDYIMDFNAVDDFNNNIISIGHIEDMNDVHTCNTCYEHYGCCRRTDNTQVCKEPIGEDVLETACKTLDGTGSSYGFYKHVCKDIVLFFRTPFARDNEF